MRFEGDGKSVIVYVNDICLDGGLPGGSKMQRATEGIEVKCPGVFRGESGS